MSDAILSSSSPLRSAPASPRPRSGGARLVGRLCSAGAVVLSLGGSGPAVAGDAQAAPASPCRWEAPYDLWVRRLDRVAHLPDGDVVIAGMRRRAYTRERPHPWLGRFGPDGTLRWEKPLFADEHAAIEGLWLDDDGHATVYGFVAGDAGTTDLWLAETDGGGEMVNAWRREPTVRYPRLRPRPDGVLAWGVAQTDDLPGPDRNISYVMRLDDDGVTQLRRPLLADQDDLRVQDIVPLADGGYLVAFIPTGNNAAGQILRMGRLGGVSWRREAAVEELPLQLLPLADGSVWVLGLRGALDAQRRVPEAPLWAARIDDTGHEIVRVEIRRPDAQATPQAPDGEPVAQPGSLLVTTVPGLSGDPAGLRIVHRTDRNTWVTAVSGDGRQLWSVELAFPVFGASAGADGALLLPDGRFDGRVHRLGTDGAFVCGGGAW